MIPSRRIKQCHPPLAIEPQSFPLGSPQAGATTGSYKRRLVAFSCALRRDKVDGSESWARFGSAPNLLRNLGSRPCFAVAAGVEVVDLMTKMTRTFHFAWQGFLD